MKMLSPGSVKKGKQEEETKRLGKIATIALLEKKELSTLTIIQNQKEKEKQRILNDFAKFESSIGTKKTALLDEVVLLERRKEEALIPLTEKEEVLNKKEIELNLRLESITEKEKVYEGKNELLMTDMETVTDKLSDLKEREEAVIESEKKSRIREKQTSASLEALNNKWAEFHSAVAKENKSIEARRIELREKEQALSIIESGFAEERKQIMNDKLYIISQRESLIPIYNEIKKHGTHQPTT